MKRTLLAVAALAAAQLATAQCTEVFISEYVEGRGNNKALELYNPTPATVTLNDYQMARYSNGDLTPNYVSFPTGTTIAPYSTLVVVLDKRNPAGTGNDTMVDMALQGLADLFLCPDYNVNKMMYFNGNDGVSLERKSNGALCDLIGVISEDPGNGWNSNPETGYMQNDYWDDNHWTYNNTMVRKASVTAGVTANPGEFNPSIEWDTLGVNVFDNLRQHACDCGAAGIDAPAAAMVRMYPNPAEGGQVTLQAAKNIAAVEIFNIVGQTVAVAAFDGSMAKVVLDIDDLSRGLYVTRVTFTDNTESTRKLQVR